MAGDGPKIFKHACTMGLEGIVSKRLDSPYEKGISKIWVKTKNPNPSIARVREAFERQKLSELLPAENKQAFMSFHTDTALAWCVSPTSPNSPGQLSAAERPVVLPPKTRRSACRHQDHFSFPTRLLSHLLFALFAVQMRIAYAGRGQAQVKSRPLNAGVETLRSACVALKSATPRYRTMPRNA
jgi:hypothetical protein